MEGQQFSIYSRQLRAKLRADVLEQLVRRLEVMGTGVVSGQVRNERLLRGERESMPVSPMTKAKHLKIRFNRM